MVKGGTVIAPYVIKLPKIFSTDLAPSVINQLNADYLRSFLGNHEEVTFDFSECISVSPVGLIYLQMWRDDLVSKGKTTFYRKSNEKTDSFLKRMHLLPRTEATDEEEIEKRFFYHIHKCNGTSDCSATHKEILSKVVLRGSVNDNTYCAIDYMINELWDNAGVHGYECYTSEVYPKPVYICAVEEDDCYEICIGDRGQGIYNSLRKNNAALQGYNKKDVMLAAIKDGVSGHPTGSPGFGLFSAAEFIRRGNGSLHLWSSGCYLTVSSKNDRIYNSSRFSGTIVSFIIKKDSFLPFEEVLSSHSVCDYQTQEYIEDMIGGLFDES